VSKRIAQFILIVVSFFPLLSSAQPCQFTITPVMICAPVTTIPWQLNGNALSLVTTPVAIAPGVIQLTSQCQTYQTGSAWAPIQVDLTQDFDLRFKVFLGLSFGADGIAFVLQSMGATAIGAAGEGLGVAGIWPFPWC